VRRSLMSSSIRLKVEENGVATQEEGRKSLMLRVIDARPEDIGRGIAKLARVPMRRLPWPSR
jgi:hypothetical protein